MTRMNTLTKLLCAVLVLCGLLCCAGAAGAEGDCAHIFADGVCTTCGLIGGYCGEEGNEQNVIWTYANGTLTISGTGAMADQFDNYNNRPWEEYVDQITTIVVSDGITSIGEAAFGRFQKLTTAKLPDSLTTISLQAFYGCTALKTVNFPANLKTIEGWAFLGCALESVTLPEGLTTIGYRAFSECKNLTSVTVPASVTTIDEGAFGYNPAKITVAEDNLNYSSDEHGVLFDKDKTTLIYCRPNIEVETYTIPSTVTEICKEAFYGCKNLATITIPDGVQKIGSSAFGGCEALTTITIPAGVTTIEAITFYDCTALTAVTIPAGVTTIDMWAFSGCTALTTVTIPASVTSIAYNAFSNCSALTTVNAPCNWDGSLYTFEDAVTVNVPDHAFTDGACTGCGLNGGYCGASTNAGGEQSVVWTYKDGVLAISGTGDMAGYPYQNNQPWFSYAASITSLYIGEGVTGIGKNAFPAFGVTSVTVPASVEYIGREAFTFCFKLESITFAEGSRLTSIDIAAFSNCVRLKQLTLPASVTSFAASAVMCCYDMTDIFVEEGSTTYKDINGVLCSADGTTLVRYPIGRIDEAYTTPDGVTIIGVSAFEGDTSLKSIIVSEGVTSIGVGAFSMCDALEMVTLPATVTSIGIQAFDNISTLTTVNAPCNWEGSLYTFEDSVTVNVAEHTGGVANCVSGTICENCEAEYSDPDFEAHTGGTANCQSGAICENCGEAYGELDYDVHAQTEVVWEWYPDYDYVYVYATLTCSDCGDELMSTYGDGEFLGETEGTDCLNPGSLNYSATLTFDDGTEATGTHAVIIPSDNHVGSMSNGFCTACGSAEMPAVDPGEYEDETWDDVYLISNAGQLYWFANEVNGGNNGIGARLTANITVPASVSKGGSIPDWEPIGQGWTPYCGAFDGQGHTISGLYCEASRAGFFGYTDYDYTISNVGVVNGTFIGSDYAGALAGYASSNISSCWASGNTVTGDYAGGLVGYNYGTITASRATNNTVEGTLAGGLVGYNNYGTVSRSYATGNTVTGDRTGGLAGENYGTIENSYATGNTAGYLVGYNGDPITNCFTDGSALFRDSYGDVTNSYYVAASATDDGGRTSAQFASGEIAYLLQSAIEPEEVYDEETGEWVMGDAPLVWGQSIGSASYPTLGGQRVYQVLACDGEGKVYSNTDKQQEHSFTDSVCVNCNLIGGCCGAEGDGTNIAWTLEDGVLTITGTGAMADYEYSEVPWFSHRYSITSLTIGEGVTHIGEFTFVGCSITELVIPASVESIGENAFMICSDLESVSFAEGSRLTTIGSDAFSSGYALKQITLPAGVTSIGDGVFTSCNSLTDIFVAEGNEAYKDIDGVLCSADGTILLVYPVGRTEETFTTPAGVKIIADSACQSVSFHTVILSDGVTSIGELAFATNPDLLEVTIPASVTSIDDSFRGCDSLTTVNVPCNWDGSLYSFKDTVTMNIAGHSYSDGVCTVCGCACPHDAGNGNTCSICGATVDRPMVTLPASLTAIDAEAFLGTAAEAIVIPANCTAIANGAFSGCSDLTVVIFAAADCTIADGAIPSGVAIIAPAGGTVETWAETNGVTFWAR